MRRREQVGHKGEECDVRKEDQRERESNKGEDCRCKEVDGTDRMREWKDLGGGEKQR